MTAEYKSPTQHMAQPLQHVQYRGKSKTSFYGNKEQFSSNHSRDNSRATATQADLDGPLFASFVDSPALRSIFSSSAVATLSTTQWPLLVSDLHMLQSLYLDPSPPT